MKAQITVIVVLLSAKTMHAKLKAHSTQTGKGMPLAATAGAVNQDICKSRVFKLGLLGMQFGDCLCLVLFKSNQQIHLLENVVIKLFICVETRCGSLDT